MSRLFILSAAVLIGFLTIPTITNAEESFRFGFVKVDITPTEPILLSGYGGRTKPFVKVREKIYARVMAIQTSQKVTSILVTVDNVGFPASITERIAKQVEKKHEVTRARFVISCSHTHTAPYLMGNLPNLLTMPIPKAEQVKTNKYTKWMEGKIVDGIDEAIHKLTPAMLYYTMGKVTFARNRRLFKNGVRVGGVNEAGPVDHSLPILKVVNSKGKTLGLVFNYACHCTSLGINEVTGDWAGFACKYVEEQTPGTVAMCTIGCGADINPIRTRVKGEDIKLAMAAGREIADVVKEVTAKKMELITSRMTSSFDYAPLQSDPYSKETLNRNLKSRSYQLRNHAEHYLTKLEKGEAIDISYPDPIHVWRFGDQLMMVFMGGETVLDYSIRLHKEIKIKHLWVSSYCDDVFAYVASERVLKEGGYEADRSMIYYLQPGPWATGTEERVIKKVHQLVKQTTGKKVLVP